MNLRALHIANFKAFEAIQRVPLRPLTLVYGANSSGKSSVLHALALAHHAIHTGDADVEQTQLGGDAIDLGGFRQYVHRRDPQRLVQFGFELSLNGTADRASPSVRAATCNVELGFARTKARYLRVAEFISQHARCTDEDVFGAFKTGREDQELDIARAQKLKHWISIDKRAKRWEYHYRGHADTCPPLPDGHTVPPPRSSIYYPPEVEVDWSGGIGLQRLTLESDGAQLMYLSNHGEWQIDVNPDHALIREIARQQTGGNGLGKGTSLCPRAVIRHGLFPRLKPHGNGDEASNDPLARTMYDLVNEVGTALESEFGRLVYIGPLRYWPTRNDTFMQRSDSTWFAGAAAWNLARTSSDVRRSVNEWLGDEEVAVGGDVGPAVGVEDGAVHGGVQVAQLGDARVGVVVVVEAVVGLGHAFVVFDHEGGAVGVVFLAGGFKGGVGLPAIRERERLKAIGKIVAEPLFQRRTEEARPNFVGVGLEGAECSVSLIEIYVR